ncbi:2256_t:CDS:2 [Paraglomus occultum]|uniref:2256_t:CDS:1 n=1 Tax=Paraglomus occultum TaxID=144539 RepID=A0A9N9BYV7_9GLOM|nr:2256_t:CDS:2 [Paraglomus occultum]
MDFSIDNIGIPSFTTFVATIVVSQVLTSVYYAHNVFGKLQIDLTHDDFLTPAEREVVASGLPLVRAMAGLSSAPLLTVLVYNILMICQIDDLATTATVAMVLWLATSSIMFGRYVTYSMPIKLYIIDAAHDGLQLLGLAVVVHYLILFIK